MTVFESVADEVTENQDYETSRECVIEWVRGDKVAAVTFPSRTKLGRKVRKLAEECPEDVIIRHENKDGSFVATIPVRFIKISSPRKVSEKQRQAAADRFRQMWQDKQGDESSEFDDYDDDMIDDVDEMDEIDETDETEN